LGQRKADHLVHSEPVAGRKFRKVDLESLRFRRTFLKASHWLSGKTCVRRFSMSGSSSGDRLSRMVDSGGQASEERHEISSGDLGAEFEQGVETGERGTKPFRQFQGQIRPMKPCGKSSAPGPLASLRRGEELFGAGREFQRDRLLREESQNAEQQQIAQY
jgi:hypothetical protein